jgi:DNA topoisomerase-1
MSDLVIVESPAKAGTIKKYLGKGFNVVASMGHIRDLPKSQLGVDVENNFNPKYINIRGKADLIKSLKKQAKQSDKVYLATDPDREGEAISWHLAYILGIDVEKSLRVTFNEITKTAVREGIKHPRTINIDLVDAQQARRILDRIVGYKLSPFLWKKIRPGLSAGRVQSVCVRLISDREQEIRAFLAEEYWTIDSELLAQNAKKPFPSKFYGTKEKKLDINTKEQADEILSAIDGKPFTVGTIKRSVRKKSPAPPFTTSTLQQEASKRLNFQAKRTMQGAQQLYEGVDIKGLGAVGLITYMRTDSLRISDDAKNEAAKFIEEKYGKQYLPESPRIYKTKNNAQDAHEAIRPSMPNLEPEKIKSDLSTDQYRLYKLIWERFIASQMANEMLDTVQADIAAGDYLFKSSGSVIKFAGYAVLYEETQEQKEDSHPLPDLQEGDKLEVQTLGANQHFTQPPARYTEASLIKALEENGIGRPSTYAPTITTILQRGYVERDAKQLKPTTLGEVTTALMKDHFANIVDVEFTANMENNLDFVADGQKNWVQTLSEFYTVFDQTLKTAEEVLGDVNFKVPDEVTDIICDLCGKNMVIKTGRFGKFLACPGYPECKNTKPIVLETGGTCPACGGRVLQKKSKNGKKYFGCEFNPKCSFMTWDEPLSEPCPKCANKTLFKKRGNVVYCAKEGCDFEEKREKNKNAAE